MYEFCEWVHNNLLFQLAIKMFTCVALAFKRSVSQFHMYQCILLEIRVLLNLHNPWGFFLQCLTKAWPDKMANRTRLCRQTHWEQGQVLASSHPHHLHQMLVSLIIDTRWPRHFWSTPTPTTSTVNLFELQTKNLLNLSPSTIPGLDTKTIFLQLISSLFTESWLCLS